MSSRYLLLVILIFTGVKAKSQTLLNADSSKIMKEVESRGGGLKEYFTEKNIEINGRYKKMVVQYPLPPEGNACLIKTTFCLTLKNKCFKYYEDYWGKELADQKINNLKTYYPKLQQVKNEFKWIDIDNDFAVRLIPEKIGNNKFASVYVLEIKKN